MNETRRALRASEESAPIQSLGPDNWSNVASYLKKKDALNLFSANRIVRESAPQFPSNCFEKSRIRAIRKNMSRDEAFRCVRSAMYNTETLQRILLCNISLSREYAEPLRLYVHLDDVGALVEESTLICFAKEGFPIELVLLYKAGQNYDEYDDTLRENGLPAFMDKALLLNGDGLTAHAREYAQNPQGPRVALEVSNEPRLDLGNHRKDFIHYVVPPHLPFLREITPCMFSFSHIQSLPEMPNVRTIDSMAFWGCVHLTTLPHMPELMCIGAYAFEQSGLTTLQGMPKLLQIKEQAFQDCRGLKSIELKSVQIIENRAFNGNTDLETLQLPSCIKYIGHYAFRGCENLRNVVVNDVQDVKWLICQCERLHEFLLGNGLVRIGTYMFAHADTPLILDPPQHMFSVLRRFGRIAAELRGEVNGGNDEDVFGPESDYSSEVSEPE